MFKRLHIIGIGGIGMSALAQIAHARGIQVQGSDSSDNANTQSLQAQGIKVFPSHHEGNINKADCVVYSTAIPPTNPERIAAQLAAAQKENITLWHRADLLRYLMEGKRTITISGTHGKTTTTALVGAVLTEAGFDPTIINGGIMGAQASNVRIGASDWMVVEGDESDGTFTQLPTDIALITNIDREHLNHYGSYDQLLAAFGQFMAGARELVVAPQTLPVPLPPAAHRFDKDAAARVQFQDDQMSWTLDGTKFNLPMIGWHNLENALAALTLARALNIPDSQTAQAFQNFQGVGRRWSKIGEKNGVSFYDDYAHHPKEIATTLHAAKAVQTTKRVIALLQPHRYSRLEELFDDFVQSVESADEIWLVPVFEAGETKNKLDSQDLLKAIERNKQPVRWVENAAALPAFIQKETRMGDVVIALGAGSIGSWLREASNVA